MLAPPFSTAPIPEVSRPSADRLLCTMESEPHTVRTRSARRRHERAWELTSNAHTAPTHSLRFLAHNGSDVRAAVANRHPRERTESVGVADGGVLDGCGRRGGGLLEVLFGSDCARGAGVVDADVNA